MPRTRCRDRRPTPQVERNGAIKQPGIHVRQAEMSRRAPGRSSPCRWPRGHRPRSRARLRSAASSSEILVQAARFDRGICLWQGAPPNAAQHCAPLAEFLLEKTLMVKPEWGTKRTCPKCSTRFYDLGKDDPVHCIECGTDFVPEPVLKSKQPLAFEAAPVAAKEPAARPGARGRGSGGRRGCGDQRRRGSRSRNGRRRPRRRDCRRGRRKLEVARRRKFPLFQRGKFA